MNPTSATLRGGHATPDTGPTLPRCWTSARSRVLPSSGALGAPWAAVARRRRVVLAGSAHREAAPSYITQIVARGNLTLTVTANGTMQPTRSINIGSELSGTVLKVNVDVNDRIKKGQVLVVLDTSKLRDQIVRSSASVAVAEAQVAQTAATVDEARANLVRFEDVARLSAGKVPSKTELDIGRATGEAGDGRPSQRPRRG